MICICYDPTPCDDKLRRYAQEVAGDNARVLYRNPRFYRSGDHEQADLVVVPEEFAAVMADDYEKIVTYPPKRGRKKKKAD